MPAPGAVSRPPPCSGGEQGCEGVLFGGLQLVVSAERREVRSLGLPRRWRAVSLEFGLEDERGLK